MSLTAQEINRFKSTESIEVFKEAARIIDNLNEFNEFYQHEKKRIYNVADQLREIVWDIQNSGLVIKR